MARLKPYEILANNGHYGKSYVDVIHMLEHYGFERSNSNGRAPHQVFQHREYNAEIGQMNIPRGRGELEPKYTLQAAKNCMEVKRLNAERRAARPALDELPDWLFRAIGGGFASSLKGNELCITHQVNGTPLRSYTIRNQAGALQVQCVQFPDEDFGFTFHYANDRKPMQVFQRQLEELDGVVCELMREGCTSTVPLPLVSEVERVSTKGRQRGD